MKSFTDLKFDFKKIESAIYKEAESKFINHLLNTKLSHLKGEISNEINSRNGKIILKDFPNGVNPTANFIDFSDELTTKISSALEQ